MKIKTSQKNQLFDIISKSKLSPTMFQLKEIDDWQTRESKCVIFPNSNGDFSFEISEIANGKILLEFSPGEERLKEMAAVESWVLIIYYFKKWVNELQEEILVEDKWKAFEKLVEDNDLVQTDQILNTHFTLPEYNDIKDKIQNTKNELLKLDFNPDQIYLIHEKLDLVLEQAQYLGKFDWRSLFVGTIMSVILQLTLTQDQGKQIWVIIKSIFSNYFLKFQ